MSVSGSVIVTAPVTDADSSGPRVRVLEPLALDRRVTEVLMEGAGDLPVYRCDTPVECLEPPRSGASRCRRRGVSGTGSRSFSAAWSTRSGRTRRLRRTPWDS